MTKYVLHHEDGTIYGFFDDNVDGDNIPESASSVTEEIWYQCIGSKERYLLIEGSLQDNPNWQAPPPIVKEPNWQGLLASLRGSRLFAKTFVLAQNNPSLLPAFTILLFALGGTNPDIADLQFALSTLKKDLGESLSELERAQINQLLIENHFPFQI